MDMKAFMKALKPKTLKKKGDKAGDKPSDYAELLTVWPNGTWTYDTDKEMDLVVRGILLDIWALEAFIAAEEAAGRKLNPGMFGSMPDPIPTGWKPSKRVIDHHASKNNFDQKKLKHIVDKLTALKNLKP